MRAWWRKSESEMNDPFAIATTPAPLPLDGRQPKLLDHRGRVLQVTAGHADIFAVRIDGDRAVSPRRHLFRIERGDIILDLPEAVETSGTRTQFIAVGGLGTEAVLLRGRDVQAPRLVGGWIARLARVIAGAHPSWEMAEATHGAAEEIAPGERRRGPARSITWVSLQAGDARLMGHEPALAA